VRYERDSPYGNHYSKPLAVGRPKL
jgi:hypothetical protein